MSSGLPASFAPRAIAIDPGNANVVYVIADTVYKTSDGGAAWAKADGGLGNPAFLSEIAISATNPSVLHVSAPGGCGLCVSTNGGSSWSTIASSGLPTAFGIAGLVQSLASDPLTPGRLYAGTPLGAYRSSDSGLTWVAINNSLASRQVVGPTLIGASPASLLVGGDDHPDHADAGRGRCTEEVGGGGRGAHRRDQSVETRGSTVPVALR